MILLISCNPGGPVSSDQDAPRPDTLIERDTMIRIMTDMHLTEAAVTFLRNKGQRETGQTDKYFVALFSKYRISKELFESNFDYYKADQEEFIRMYEEVIKNLEGIEKQSHSSEE
jgi:hypothetical protein